MPELLSDNNGVRIFDAHKILWRLLGLLKPEQHKIAFHISSFVVNFGVSLCYPLHLMIGLFHSKTANEIFKNMAINFTCCATSIKSFFIWKAMDNAGKIDDMIVKLDKRIVKPAHIKYYREQVIDQAMLVFHIYCVAYFGCSITSEVATIIAGIISQWRLMYPAYFPFDAYHSAFSYFVAHVYQYWGVGVHILQNLANDSYAAMALAMLSGHVHLLGDRLASIGYDASKSMEENNAELLACIEDYQILLDFRCIIERMISVSMCVQLISTGFSICISILYLIFFASDTFSVIYYGVYGASMALQIFPSCYYGTVVSMEFDKLTYSMFSSNWMDQNKVFKQNLRILAEQTLRKRNVMAGGIFYIDLDAFFATCRGAYSLFSVVVQMQ